LVHPFAATILAGVGEFSPYLFELVRADPARLLRLLSILLAKDDLTACTCELTEPLGLGQPTVSHHLRRLHEAGLVDAERRGLWTFYRARPEALVEQLRELLNSSVRRHLMADVPTGLFLSGLS